MSLIGCASTTSSPACVPLIAYTDAQQEAVADELDQHGAEVPMTQRFIVDYGKTRAAIRVCRKAR